MTKEQHRKVTTSNHGLITHHRILKIQIYTSRMTYVYLHNMQYHHRYWQSNTWSISIVTLTVNWYTGLLCQQWFYKPIVVSYLNCSNTVLQLLASLFQETSQVEHIPSFPPPRTPTGPPAWGNKPRHAAPHCGSIPRSGAVSWLHPPTGSPSGPEWTKCLGKLIFYKRNWPALVYKASFI